MKMKMGGWAEVEWFGLEWITLTIHRWIVASPELTAPIKLYLPYLDRLQEGNSSKMEEKLITPSATSI